MNNLNISSKSRLISTAILGALALGWGTISIAADASDAPHVIVKFNDLNLSNLQGAAALYRRIWAAAATVCSLPNDGSLSSWTHTQSCIHKAVANAVTDVGQPELSAIYIAKNAQPRPIVVAESR